MGTVGKPISGVEVKIADDGEILTRGPHVMAGYWNLPEDTAETIRDGWLHTGDLGEIEDGYIRITGRKKDLIVTAGGKNIAPSYLEGLLTEDPLIAQAVVIGDAKNYLTALIVPNPEPLRAEIIKRQIPVFSPAEALAHPKVRELYAEAIKQRLADVSHAEQVQKFTLVPRGFTMETGEMTPTLKVRRNVVIEEFRRRNRQDVRQRPGEQGNPVGRRLKNAVRSGFSGRNRRTKGRRKIGPDNLAYHPVGRIY